MNTNKIKEALKADNPENYRLLAIMPLIASSIIFFQTEIAFNAISVYASSLIIFEILNIVLLKRWQMKYIEAVKLIFYSSVFFLMIPIGIPLFSVIIGSIVMSVAFFIQENTGKKIFTPPLTGWLYIFIFYSFFFVNPKPSNMLSKYLEFFPDIITSATPFTQYFQNKTIFPFRQSILGFVLGTPAEIFSFSILIGLYLLLARFIISYHIIISAFFSYIIAAIIVVLFKIPIENNIPMPSIQYFVTCGAFFFSLAFLIDDGFAVPITLKGKIIYGILFGLLSIAFKTIFAVASMDVFILFALPSIIKFFEKNNIFNQR